MVLYHVPLTFTLRLKLVKESIDITVIRTYPLPLCPVSDVPVGEVKELEPEIVEALVK